MNGDLALEGLQPGLAQIGIEVDLLDARLNCTLEILVAGARTTVEHKRNLKVASQG